MRYFKVLPTENRFKNLTIYQKLILSSSIKEEQEDYAGLIDRSLDVLTLYINPKLFSDTHKDKDDYSRKNSQFDIQSRVGKETGKMYVPQSLAAAIRKSAEAKKKILESGSFRPTPRGSKGGTPILG
jgi:hypothetical protein